MYFKNNGIAMIFIKKYHFTISLFLFINFLNIVQQQKSENEQHPENGSFFVFSFRCIIITSPKKISNEFT